MKLSTFFFLFFSLSAYQGLQAQQSRDSRFGTIGPNNGNWQWSRDYNEDFSLLGFVPDPHHLYTVGKLDILHSLPSGQEDWCSGTPGPTTCVHPGRSVDHQYQIYSNILASDMPLIQALITKFNSTYNNISSANNYTGPQIHISIGNEPNWYPYVDPIAYARIFNQYYHKIKDPLPGGLGCNSCVIHNGAVMLANLDLSLSPDLSWAYTNGLIVLLDIIVILAEPAAYHTYNYMTWTNLFLQHLIAAQGGRYDIFDIHTYDINYALAGVGVNQNALPNIDKFIALLRGGTLEYQVQLQNGEGHMADGGPLFCVQRGSNNFIITNTLAQSLDEANGFPLNFPSMNKCIETLNLFNSGDYITKLFSWDVPNPVVWVDEFGTVSNQNLNTIDVMNSYLNYFMNSPYIKKWFWYKNNGSDSKLLSGVDAPIDVGLNSADPVQLCPDAGCTSLTGLGTNYLNSQDPAFINYSYPRLSFDPPNLANRLGLAKWSNDPNNFGLLWDFSKSADVQAWGIFSNFSQFQDGVKVNSACPTGILSKNFSDAERLSIAGTRYFVLEKGIHVPGVSQNFVIRYRNIQNHATIGQIEVGSSNAWVPTVNPLAQQGMPDVIEYANYVPAGNELTGIDFEDPLSEAICATNPNGTLNTNAYSFSYGRAYFSFTNPVPLIGTSGQYYTNKYAGPIFQGQVYANQTALLPINLNTAYCTNCTLSLDAASVANGLSITSDNFIQWTPGFGQVGTYTGTLSLNIGGTVLPKTFTIQVDKPKPSILPALYLLLN